ncbi:MULTISPECIES: hypothetical protein [unclassified Actinomyces]|uniref:hypothetical protein n=1 Tax=unclassified Actinomyces TaxID=2609248 RepID=UPI000D592879|nr:MULTISPECIES: hypothetical protein [unclassified Actinomyces]RAX22679.1 hypothetical protein DRB07_07630 [Actinomyces sp. Z3]
MEPVRLAVVPQPGNARDPKKFVGRVAVSDRARERLLAGVNLLLTDPRRMGKTYWLRAFAARETAFQPYFIDYEGVGTTERFLVVTAGVLCGNPELPVRVREFLKTVFDHVDTVGVAGLTLKTYHRQTPPLRLLTDILETLDQGDDSAIPLILMDEVPMAIDNIASNEGPQAAKELLQTLRRLRQQYTRVRWIVTGSVGFHHVLEQAGTTSGDINDLEALHLGPMPDGEARELAQALLRGIGQMPSDLVVAELVGVAGGVPFIMHAVARGLDRAGGTLGPQEVREAFEDIIDDPDDFRHLKHFEERVRVYYGQNARLAARVLSATATAAPRVWVLLTEALKGDSSEELDEVVGLLCSDHYLERRGSRVRWRYPAFAYIWARKHNLLERP